MHCIAKSESHASHHIVHLDWPCNKPHFQYWNQSSLISLYRGLTLLRAPLTSSTKLLNIKTLSAVAKSVVGDKVGLAYEDTPMSTAGCLCYSCWNNFRQCLLHVRALSIIRCPGRKTRKGYAGGRSSRELLHVNSGSPGLRCPDLEAGKLYTSLGWDNPNHLNPGHCFPSQCKIIGMLNAASAV